MQVRISRDLALNVPDEEYYQRAQRVTLYGLLLMEDFAFDRLIFSLNEDEGTVWVLPGELLSYRLLNPGPKRPGYLVRSPEGDRVEEVPAAVYGPAGFSMPAWLEDRLYQVTARQLEELRRARQAAEAEEKRRKAERERRLLDARRTKAIKKSQQLSLFGKPS